MNKIQRISELQYSFSFPRETEILEFYRAKFLKSDLGKLHEALPLKELAKALELKEHQKGQKCIFSPEGKVALMFLKNYASCSDKKLMEQLNSNIDYQFFCNIYIGLNKLENFKIISQIRCEIANKLKINELEQVLCKKWLPFMKNLDSMTQDATCYESYLRPPTDQKLLWEAVCLLYKMLKKIYKKIGIPQLRSKFLDWKKKYISYSKMRRKTKKRRKSVTRGLLRLLKKFLKEYFILENLYDLKVNNKDRKKILILQKIHEQQSDLFYKGIKPKNRIVSISKSYIRPIVRGKETKKVEFGAKVNKIQIDGINFIDKLSFEAFNEGIRFVPAIYKAENLTKTRIKISGADAIYATNANRKFATSNGIKTDFRPKGRRSKHHKIQKKLKNLIRKERSSRLEGSFGTEKEHYYLQKIRARTEKTEILWIFFGIHVANALKIGRRMAEEQEFEAKKVA